MVACTAAQASAAICRAARRAASGDGRRVGAAAAGRCLRSCGGSLGGVRRLSAGRDGSYDVAIVGGGVVGSSVALHLAASSTGSVLRIAVVERDPVYKWSSAPRSAGGIRQQFSLPTNIELSMYGIEFLRRQLPELCAGLDVDTDVQLQENGYLILASPGAGAEALRANVETQHACGATWISLLERADLEARFPWLSTEGIECGGFGERNEGYFDPWALLQAMKKGAAARGVEFISSEVVGFDRDPSSGEVRRLRLADGSGLAAGRVVNAAGAFGGRLVGLIGAEVTPLPVVPRKRCMWLVRGDAAWAGGRPLPPDNTPLTVDPSGVYFRSEGRGGGRFVCGVSPRPEDDPDGVGPEDLEVVDHDLFEGTIWPTLAERAPAFEALRVEGSWAGFYEYNTLDQNGVVGWHVDVPNLLLACGFSGHGLQHAPGVGRACAELLLHGGYRTIDLSCLGFGRVARGEQLLERGIY